MLEIENLLQGSYLITVPGQGLANRDDCSNSIKGEYYNILKSFLNLIHKPLLVKFNMEKEIDTA